MDRLDPAARALFALHSIGLFAKADANGASAVSLDATWLVLDDHTLALAHMRSPGKVANLQREPRAEIAFIDPSQGTELRARGRGRYLDMAAAACDLRRRFDAEGPELFALMQGLVIVSLTRAEPVTSPAYDVGHGRDELAKTWLGRFAQALGLKLERRADDGTSAS